MLVSPGIARLARSEITRAEWRHAQHVGKPKLSYCGLSTADIMQRTGVVLQQGLGVSLIGLPWPVGSPVPVWLQDLLHTPNLCPDTDAAASRRARLHRRMWQVQCVRGIPPRELADNLGNLTPCRRGAGGLRGPSASISWLEQL